MTDREGWKVVTGQLDEPQWDPPVTVGVRIVSVVDDCMQHAGQMAYIRGLIEDRHWLPY